MADQQLAPKLFLTGRPGIGKTTVALKVAEMLRPWAYGFCTEEMREGGMRVGFRVRDISSAREGLLSHIRVRGQWRVGKYGVDVSAFEQIAIPALEHGLRFRGCIIVDEIGKMELCSSRFVAAVEQVLDSQHPLLATIPLFRHPVLDSFRKRPDVSLVQVTPSNRDSLPLALASQLAEFLGIGIRPQS